MVHRFSINGYYMLLDVNSGAVYSVSEAAYETAGYFLKEPLGDICEALSSSFDKETVTEAYEEIKSLYDQGVLFSDEAVIPELSRESVVKAMCLSVAHDCNLRCGYCFAGEGGYGGQRGFMTFDTGKAAIDYLISHSGKRINLEVDFFGGEPLMNFDVVKRVVLYARSIEKARSKRFRFTVTTNGVLLSDDKMAFINEHMSNIVFSIDGRKSVNDGMRKTVDGGGSYDVIADKFIKAAESRGERDYYARGTFTARNLDFSKDALHLADMGFKHVSVEPVVCSPDEVNDYAITDEHLPQIFNEYETLTREMTIRHKEGKPFVFFHFMIDLSGGPCIYKRVSGCGAGGEYIAVTPEGDIYPCHQFIGRESFKLGSVFSESETESAPKIKEAFENRNVFTLPGCKDCFAKFYCGGGCAANAFTEHGALQTRYGVGCEMQKKRVECALALKAALSGENEEQSQ